MMKETAVNNEKSVAELSRSYESYKDSGVEWLGEIPEHWVVKKMKFIGDVFAGISGKKGDDFSKEYTNGIKSFIPFTNICNNLRIDENQYQFVKIDVKENQNRVKKNDILFLMSSETLDDIAKCSIYLGDKEELYLNSFCKGFRISRKDINPEYINYLLSSKIYRNYFALVGRGFTRINLKQEFINDASVTIPPLQEQTKIAQFLDDKTTKIDDAIAIKEQQIQLLKERKQILIHNAVTKGIRSLSEVEMKDSGVEWIGVIPEHWVISKIGHFAKVGNGSTPSRDNSKYWKNGTIPWIASGKVNDFIINRPSEYVTTIGLRDSSLRIFKKGTVLIGIVGQGKTRGTSALLNIDATINQNIAGIEPLEDLDSIYLHNFLIFSYSEIRNCGKGSNQEALNCELVKSFRMTIPPLSEQKEISVYIEIASQKIETAISLKQQEIAKLKEYKRSLINGVVTGKVRVC